VHPPRSESEEPQPGEAPHYEPRYLEQDKARIDRYVKANPESFAGVWIEPDGSFVVAFTGDVDMHLRALRAFLDAPDRVTVLRFRYTYQHLLDLTHSIVAILGSAEGLSNWGPDTKANKVYIEVLLERIDEVRLVFQESHPDDVLSHRGLPLDPCSRGYSGMPPFRRSSYQCQAPFGAPGSRQRTEQ